MPGLLKWRLVLLPLILFAMFATSPRAFATTASPRERAQSATGQTFSCGAHCYGRFSQYIGDYQSPIFPQFWGAETDVDVIQLAVTTPNTLVSNEMWLAEDTLPPNGCPAATLSFCWIEVGYVSGTAAPWIRQPGEYLFWADVRPNHPTGCASPTPWFCLHLGPRLAPGDYGHKLHLQISNLGYLGTTQSWAVSAVGAVSRMYGTSTLNALNGTRIDIGQELSGQGTSGSTVNAPKALFDNNRFQLIVGTGNWVAFSAPGTTHGDNPPWGGWNLNRSPTNTGTGGEFYTCTKTYYGRNPC